MGEDGQQSAQGARFNQTRSPATQEDPEENQVEPPHRPQPAACREGVAGDTDSQTTTSPSIQKQTAEAGRPRTSRQRPDERPGQAHPTYPTTVNATKGKGSRHKSTRPRTSLTNPRIMRPQEPSCPGKDHIYDWVQHTAPPPAAD